MQQRKLFIGAAAILVCGIGWYLFRPERLFTNVKVNETFPAGATGQAASTAHGPDVLLSGRFHDAAHKTSGAATLFQLADGKRVLRLTDFETSNGPDVQVYLVAAPDAKDNATVTQAGFIHLGALKGNTGDQNYDVPADADLGTYRAVTIWCRRFGVNFGTAPLMAGGGMMKEPAAVSTGRFHDGAHKTYGMAAIYQLSDGRRLLRLTDFATSNGPDVQVYLVAASDAMDNATVTNAGFLHLGALKGNTSDQNYEVPADADLNKYRAVTIWCRRFGVNFGTAPLQPQLN